MTRSNLKDLTRTKFQGWTDSFKITQADLAASTSTNTALAQVLTALAPGDIVDEQVLIEVITAATGTTTLTGSLGVTAALTQFIGNSDLTSGGSLYYAQAGSVGPYVATTAVNLILNLIPDVSHSLSQCTALEVHVWAKISRASERQNVQF